MTLPLSHVPIFVTTMRSDKDEGVSSDDNGMQTAFSDSVDIDMITVVSDFVGRN